MTAERSDMAHRQIIRVRQGIVRWKRLSAGAAKAQAAIETFGDARLAMIALNRAVAMALDIKSLYQIRSPVPRILKTRADGVREIRDAYEHIDQRVRGRKRGRKELSAEDVFNRRAVLVERRMKYSRWSVGIDEDATKLCLAIRDFLISSWEELETGTMRLL